MNTKFVFLAFSLITLCVQVKATNKLFLEVYNESPVYQELNIKEKNDPINEIPLYNLFYLSKALSDGGNNVAVLSYVNSLFSKNKYVDEDKNFIMNFVSYSSVKSIWENKFDLYLEYFTEKYTKDSKARPEEFLNENLGTLNTFISEPYIKVFFTENNKKELSKTALFKSLLRNQYVLANIRKIALIEPINNIVDTFNSNISPDGTSVDVVGLHLRNLDDYYKLDSLANTSISQDSLGQDLIKRIRQEADNSCQKIKSYLAVLPDNSIQIRVSNLEIAKEGSNYKDYMNEYKSIYDEIKHTVKVLTGSIVNELVKIEVSRHTNDNNIFPDLLQENARIQAQVLTAQTAIQHEQSIASGFKLPSEGDVINALAQFMANRAKQEAMIWFVKNLQQDLQSMLLWDMFPETKGLVDTYDGMSMPDFNDTWRLALSKDLVQMPNNMIQGQWLSEYANNKKGLNELKTVVLLSNYFYKLIREKNNYRSVLQNFYLYSNELGDMSDANGIKDAIHLLYVICNEFYSANGTNISYLTLDQIESIDLKQWNILLYLIKIKYGDRAFKVFKNLSISDKLSLEKLTDNERKFYENVDSTYHSKLDNVKLNRIVQNFTQLQTLSKMSSGNEEAMSFSLVWDKMIELLKFVDPNFDIVTGKFNEKDFRDIAQLEALHKIYGHISRKEFKPAVNSTIDLVKPIIGYEKYTVSMSKDSIYIKTGSDSNTLLMNLNPNKNDILKMLVKSNNYVLLELENDSIGIKVNKKDNGEFSLNELVDEFKNIRYSSKESQVQPLYYLGFKERFPNLWKFRKAVFTSAEMETIQLENQFKLLNAIVDLYDNPKNILTKPVYTSFKLKENIKYSLLKNNSVEMLISTTSMFSNIINSKDQTGIYKAIQDLAAPPESYMIKRNSAHSWTLNGYVGGYGGFQEVLSTPSDYKKSFIYGITAPIGVTYNYKRFGLFFQGLELGNIVNHYLWNTIENTDKQKFTIKELFSPGISILHNISNSPFVGFVGVKAVQIDKRWDNNVIINKDNLDLLQFTIGVKFDIPFLTIYRSGY